MPVPIDLPKAATPDVPEGEGNCRRIAASDRASLAVIARATGLRSVAAAALLFASLAAGPAAGETTYEIVAGESELSILVFRAGALARLGHNHVISTSDISGTAVLGSSPGDSSVELTVPVSSFVVDDALALEQEGSAFAGERSADDVAGTRENMLGAELLHAEKYDEVRLGSDSISGEFPQVTLNARIVLKGVEHTLALPVFVSFRDGGLVASGSREVAHAELGLSPFEAAFGALRVAEDMIFRYRIVARESREQPARPRAAR